MTQRQTAKEYLADHQARADAAFKDHVIRKRDERSWLCFRPYTDAKAGWHSTYWFEVIVLAGGELYVHGDISGMHFAHYGAHKSAEEVLRWMGAHPSVDSYVLQKASIGMQPCSQERSIVEMVDDGVWLDEALSYIGYTCFEEERPGFFDDEAHAKLKLYEGTIPEWLSDAVVRVLDGDSVQESTADFDFERGACEADVHGWGEVPSTRLIYAHAALRALVRLLDAEKQVSEEASP